MIAPYYEDAASGITIYHGDCREVLGLSPPVPWTRLSPTRLTVTRTEGRFRKSPASRYERRPRYETGTHRTTPRRECERSSSICSARRRES